jgi:hypothetical protein
MRSRCCLCVYVSVYPPIIARQRLGKSPLIVAKQQLGKHPPIIARQRLGKNPLIVARQRLSRNVTAVTNTNATIQKLLEPVFFYMALVASRKVGDRASQNLLLLFPVYSVFTLSLRNL